ncbi:MAG: MraY family glycosyltransferase, partial [Cyanobacteria bacterium J06641_5]
MALTTPASQTIVISKLNKAATGLSAGVSGIAALSIGVTALTSDRPAIALFALALAGSNLGFLRYNFNPATIFMGDGGSYFLGFGLAGLCVLEFATVASPVQLLPFVILAVPILDMVFVILARLQDGQSPFTPDKRHLHHRLLALGASQRSSAIYIYGLTLLSGSSAIALLGLTWGYWVATASGAFAIALSWQLYQQQAPKQES